MLHDDDRRNFFLIPYLDETQEKIFVKISNFVEEVYNAKVKKCGLDVLNDGTKRIDVYLYYSKDFFKLNSVGGYTDYTIRNSILCSAKQIIVDNNMCDYFAPFDKLFLLLKCFEGEEASYIRTQILHHHKDFEQFYEWKEIREISPGYSKLLVLFDTKESMESFIGSEKEKKLLSFFWTIVKKYDVYNFLTEIDSTWYYYEVYDVFKSTPNYTRNW